MAKTTILRFSFFLFFYISSSFSRAQAEKKASFDSMSIKDFFNICGGKDGFLSISPEMKSHNAYNLTLRHLRNMTYRDIVERAFRCYSSDLLEFKMETVAGRTTFKAYTIKKRKPNCNFKYIIPSKPAFILTNNDILLKKPDILCFNLKPIQPLLHIEIQQPKKTTNLAGLYGSNGVHQLSGWFFGPSSFFDPLTINLGNHSNESSETTLKSLNLLGYDFSYFFKNKLYMGGNIKIGALNQTVLTQTKKTISKNYVNSTFHPLYDTIKTFDGIEYHNLLLPVVDESRIIVNENKTVDTTYTEKTQVPDVKLLVNINLQIGYIICFHRDNDSNHYLDFDFSVGAACSYFTKPSARFGISYIFQRTERAAYKIGIHSTYINNPVTWNQLPFFLGLHFGVLFDFSPNKPH